MKKVLIILMLIGGMLYAKDTCYSVQLLSRVDNGKGFDLPLENYPEDCKLMKIGRSYTLRCGCFDQYQSAQQHRKSLAQQYKHAMVVSTYKYRFEEHPQQDTNYLEKGIVTPLAKEEAQYQQEDVQEQQEEQSPQTTEIDFNDKLSTCYSVQIKRTPKTQSNLNTLLSLSYPQGCKVMGFHYSYGVRCGCYDTKSQAQTLRSSLVQEYKNARVVDTYKYRFADEYSVEKQVQNQQHYEEQPQQTTRKRKVELSQDEQELRLMLQVFLYKSDLRDAYRVAKIGVRKYPNSYYWNQKMAQIAQWSDKSDESMKYLKRVYAISHSPMIEEKLIDYGSSQNKYEEIAPLVLNRLHRDPSEKNIKFMIYIYKKLGEPEKILNILESEYRKNPSNKLLLTSALRMSLEMGSLEDAKRYVEMIEQNKPYSKEDAALIARYYYVTRDVPQAYNALLDATQTNTEKDEYVQKYYELKSDLGWYLQKNIPAAEASKTLIDLGKGRLVDYERVSYVYKESDPKVAVDAVYEGYEKYKLPYLFYSYANDAINMQKYDELSDLMEKITKGDDTFEKDPLFWIIKAKVYGHYKKRDLEEEALLKALELAPDNYQVKVSLLWHFINIKDNYKLKVLLMNLEEQDSIDESLYFPMASAYFYLTDINRASYYMHKILETNDEMAKTTEFKFLQAYIYQIQNRPNAYKRVMGEILDIMQKDAKQNPQLWENSDFLSTYLRASMNLTQNEKFEKKLKKYKPYLKKEDYKELAYSYATKIHAFDKARKIYNKSKHRALWMEFSEVLNYTNHSKIENMLSQYLYTLSRGDAIVATKDDGQIAQAQSLNFESLDHNSFNQNMYIQHLDLVKKRNDLFDMKTSYYHREPLLQKFVKVKNQTYLEDGFYLYTGLGYFINSSMDDSILINVPKSTSYGSVGMKKEFNKAHVGFDVEYHDKMDRYLAYRLYGSYRLTDRITTDLLLGKSIDTGESTQLYLAGKKDTINPHIMYQIVPSTLIDFVYEYNRYYSADDVYLGDGNYARIIINQLFKSGYPDINIGLFYDRGLYTESSDPNGVIDTIQTQNFPILPRDFYNYGVHFAYGMVNSDIYTRVWRPFFETSAYYNSDMDEVNFALNCGIGGKVYTQDHLVIGANYTEAVNGVGGTVYELYLDYKFLYHLPR